PMRRASREEDVANLVAYLSSEQANYVTGQLVGVTGGADLFAFYAPTTIQRTTRSRQNAAIRPFDSRAFVQRRVRRRMGPTLWRQTSRKIRRYRKISLEVYTCRSVGCTVRIDAGIPIVSSATAKPQAGLSQPAAQ